MVFLFQLIRNAGADGILEGGSLGFPRTQFGGVMVFSVRTATLGVHLTVRCGGHEAVTAKSCSDAGRAEWNGLSR